MIEQRFTRILLVDDDEDTFVITRQLLASIQNHDYQLEWASSYRDGLDRITAREHEVYLIDYRLGPDSGLDLIREADLRGCPGPWIMLTGLGNHEVDVSAARAGAADYLVKDELDPASLERSIRYALERSRLIGALERRADQLRLLASELTRVEQRERRRIVRLLHDHLQQMLVAAKMRVSLVPRETPDRQTQAVQEVNHLLDQILDASRTLALELTPPVLYDSGLAAALQWLGRWMEEHHQLQVDLDIDEQAEPEAECSRTFLFEATRELLFNVITHAGTRRAKVSMHRVEPGQTRVCVEDAGIGFDPTKLEQQDTGETHFGIFSIRERLDLLGGQLEVDSAPGEGTRITMHAPRQALEETHPLQWSQFDHELQNLVQTGRLDSHHPAPPEAVRRRQLRVLLADDHRILREGLAGILRRESDIQLVGEAADGHETVELAHRLRPDVVVMDVNMPRLNGVEATRQIKRELPDVRIVGLSIHEEQDMATAMRNAGADTYLTKGGPAQHLLAAIRGRPASAPRPNNGNRS